MSHMEIRRRIGNFLKAKREQARMSVTEAAGHISLLSETQLIQIEDGLAPIRLSDIYAFANIYNIEPVIIIDLIYDVTSMDPMTQEKDLNQILSAHN